VVKRHGAGTEDIVRRGRGPEPEGRGVEAEKAGSRQAGAACVHGARSSASMARQVNQRGAHGNWGMRARARAACGSAGVRAGRRAGAGRQATGSGA